MIHVSSQMEKGKENKVSLKTRNYSEVIEFLDSCRPYEYSSHSLERMKALDKLFDNASNKVDLISVSGTNGKSLTINLAAKLLKEEGFKVGIAYSSHFLTYNERLACDSQIISNKEFAQIVNEVINKAELHNIQPTSYEIITMAALLYFNEEKADVALFEVCLGGRFDATAIFSPKVVALTRIAESNNEVLGNDLDAIAFEMMDVAKKGAWVISAEQSKIRLQKMKVWAEERGLKWSMPIRKLASLPYIFEQLYGRVASLGERIAQIYVEEIRARFSPFLRGNLLATKRGQRGRPTLEAKRQAETHPLKTLKCFWNEQFSLLRGRFELLDKEKPSVLLDNASNIDALQNLFLGIRLLHYQRPLKGLALIFSLNDSIDVTQAVKLVRYLLKKVNGQVFFIPLTDAAEKGNKLGQAMQEAKELNVKAKVYSSFCEALQAAKAMVDERNGLICLTGSPDIISHYWNYRDIKKF